MARASSVLPTPGTSSIRAWPSASRATSRSRRASVGPDDRLRRPRRGRPPRHAARPSAGRRRRECRVLRPHRGRSSRRPCRIVRRRSCRPTSAVVHSPVTLLWSPRGNADRIARSGQDRRLRVVRGPGPEGSIGGGTIAQPMAGPDLLLHGTPGFALPAFDRLAPPPSPDLMGARIEAQSRPGDVVVDLFGSRRLGGPGGARPAASGVLLRIDAADPTARRGRPPAARHPPSRRGVPGHLGVAARHDEPQGGARRAVRDPLRDVRPHRRRRRLIWESDGSSGRAGGPSDPQALPLHDLPRPAGWRGAAPRAGGRGGPRRAPRQSRCGPPAWRAAARPVSRPRRQHGRWSTSCSRCIRRASSWACTRSSSGSTATCARRRSKRRFGSRCSRRSCRRRASTLPGPAREPADRRRPGPKLPTGGQWRERNPWLAFEDAYRLVRGFVQRLEGIAVRGLSRRDSGRTCGASPRRRRRRSSGSARRVAAVARGRGDAAVRGRTRSRASGSSSGNRRSGRARTACRSATTRRPGCWATTPRRRCRSRRSSAPRPSSGGAGRRPVLKPSLEAVAPLLTRDARVVLAIEEGGPEAVVATVLGAVAAGYRLVAAQLDEPTVRRERRSSNSCRPARRCRPGARTRANVSPAARCRAAPGTRSTGPARGLFAPPERVGRGAFSRDRGRADDHRHGRRDPPGARRAGRLGASARRDPRRPRCGRTPAAARAVRRA